MSLSKGFAFAAFSDRTLASIFDMKRYIILIVASVLIINAYSQRVGVEGLIGYSAMVVPTNGPFINGVQISILSNFYPPKASFFSFTTGIVFQNENEWNFLKVPVKLTFLIGKKVTFLFGGGLAGNYVMLPKESYNKYGIISKSDFTLNGMIFLGFSVNIIKNWKIKFIPEYESSLTTLYKSFGGRHGYDYEKYHSISFNLGVIYIFNNIKN
ncbi:MAG: hypothetical protein WCI48_11735 [Bacteroidota bacterium]